jgi:CDP-diacylglycerol--glycerol-3-phosphate 3-phosphatidyltransferase
MSVATCITLSRLLLTVLMLSFFYRYDELGYTVVLFFFALAVISDILDGYFARKFDQISDIGAKLDPLIDKIMMYSLLFSLFHLGIYNPLVIFSIFFRDMIVDGLRNYISELSTSYGSNLWGKAKFAFQSFSICSSLVYCIDGTLKDCIWLANAFLFAALVLSLPGLLNIILDSLRMESGQRRTESLSTDLSASGGASRRFT